MKERPLTFRRNEDETLVVLNDENLANFKKKFNELMSSMHLLKEGIEKKTLKEGFKATLLSVSEMYMMDILNTMGYQGHLEVQKQERFAEIRGLNEENRALRKQLGEKVSNEDVRERLKNISRLIRDWWNDKGLCYVKDIRFTEYGHIKVSFGGSYSGIGDSKEEEKAHVKYLIDYGFELDNMETGERAQLLDTDKNRELFVTLVKSKFPSAQLETITNWSGRGKHLQIREAEFYIHNLDDIS